ncbi:hypothetical protein BDZ97DRAFT_1758244 [Flammula alnicola]|nr:hypothetical protein BDZ97DRAFT_1758244 [Flammula alnicola]
MRPLATYSCARFFRYGAQAPATTRPALQKDLASTTYIRSMIHPEVHLNDGRMQLGKNMIRTDFGNMRNAGNDTIATSTEFYFLNLVLILVTFLFIELSFTRLNDPTEDYRYILSGEGFTNLEELVLDSMDITDDALTAGAGGPSSLKRLELRNCKHITGAGLLHFAQPRSSDFLLSLEACQGVTKKDIETLSILRTQTK